MESDVADAIEPLTVSKMEISMTSQNRPALTMLSVLVMCLLTPQPSGPGRVASADIVDHPTGQGGTVRARLNEVYGRLPLSFEANRGQTDSRVDFISRGSGYTLFVTSTEAVLSLPSIPLQRDASHEQPGMATLRMQLVGANAAALSEGREELPGKVNYFRGTDPARWRTGIATYAQVGYRDVYPGIDLVYYGNQRQLEYDFVVEPGVDPGAIALTFEGAEALQVDGEGNLILQTAGGQVMQRAPRVYQEIDGIKSDIPSRYVLYQARGSRSQSHSRMVNQDREEVRFHVGRYDSRRPLVIDPVLVYSTYLGGSGTDQGFAIAIGTDGSAYVTGVTRSTDFPTASGAFDTTLGGTRDVFVTKLAPSGTALAYSTYLGGNRDDSGAGIAVDGDGNAYVTGGTDSVDFPTTPGSFDTTPGGGRAFVTKLAATGAALVYSTYLGPGGHDGPTAASGIAVDSAGCAYVTGSTFYNFPTTPGSFDTAYNSGNGTSDAFVTKLAATGMALVYSTYLGGSFHDIGEGIAVDSAGSAYVTGWSTSHNFPTTPGAFDTTALGVYEAFVTKLQPDGSALGYSTYLGGTGLDFGYGIAVDSAGNAYVTGATTSVDFPTTSGAFAITAGGSYDAFVAMVEAGGGALAFSTYLGGSNYDSGEGLTVDGAGSVYVTGYTQSDDFPTTPGAFDSTHLNLEAFVTKLEPSGAALAFSTYYGGTDSDVGYGIALDSAGGVYVTGYTASSDFQTTPGAFDTTWDGSLGAFAVKVGELGPPGSSPFVSLSTITLTFPEQAVGTSSASQEVTLTNTGTGPLTIGSVTASGDFGQTNTCGSTLAPGAACTISITFTPSETGARSGTIAIVDDAADSPQQVTLDGVGISAPVNTPPTSQDDTVATNEDRPVNLNVLANDVDADGDALSVVLISPPAQGTLVANGGGAFTYTPQPDFYGTDVFAYRADDGQAAGNIATITITVNPVNDAPDFTRGPDQHVTQPAGPQSVSGWATGITAGPTNEIAQVVEFVVTNNHGALFASQPAISSAGTLTYAPAAGQTGSAAVTVHVRDNGGTANGGVDGSPFQAFTISVSPPSGTGPGPLDASCGGSGRVMTPFSGFAQWYDVAVQSDGKVVAAGLTDGDFLLARYNTDCTLDAGFGVSGIVTVDFFGHPDGARAVALQADGKILVGGDAYFSAGGPYGFAIARLNVDGSRDDDTAADTTPGDRFGDAGKVVIGFGSGTESLSDLAVQSDGKIVAVGHMGGSGNLHVAVARLNTDGTPDASFDGDGKVMFRILGNESVATAVAMSGDKIVVGAAAMLSSDAAARRFAVARLNGDGSFDTLFGSGGMVIAPDFGSGSEINDIFVQPGDGKVVAGGYTGLVSTNPDLNQLDFALVRYNPDGTLDQGFGVGGRVVTDLGTPVEIVSALAQQTDGSIIAAGTAGAVGTSPGTYTTDFAVARYTQKGALEGTTLTDFLGRADFLYGAAIQPNGRIVAVGQAHNDSGLSGVALARHIGSAFEVAFDLIISGAGTVTSSPAGINCPGTCKASFTTGSTVTLTATASAGSTFTGWSGGCTGTGACAVTLSAATSVTAAFQAVHLLIVQKQGAGIGTVTSTPAGINCGANCRESFPSGTVVNLSAAAIGQSAFGGWSGGCTGTGGCSVTMDAAASVTAIFPSFGSDLVETAVSNPPAAALPGASFAVTETTTNQGATAAGGSSTRFYLSLDAAWNAADRLLTGTRAVPGLGYGISSTGTRTVTIPATTPLGTYWLLACADDAGVVVEANEANNCSPSASTIEVGGPDLVETSVNNPPLIVAPAATFSVADTVHNQGNAGAGQSRTQYYLSIDALKSSSDQKLSGGRAVPALAAGTASTGTGSVTVPAGMAPGTFTLLACADDAKQVAEVNEGNNCIAALTTVTIMLPDLVETSISDPPATAAPGGRFTATDTVQNSSLAPAGKSTTRYYLSLDGVGDPGDVLLTGTRAVAILDPGATSTGDRLLTIPAGIALGSYRLIACADDLARVRESSDTNNCAVSAGPVTVVWPDLITLTVSSPPAAALRGSKFTLTDAVTNQGGTDAGASTIRYFLSIDTLKDAGDLLLSGTRSVATLAPGAISMGSRKVAVPSTAPFSTYYVIACADDLNKVGESDNDNNCRASATTVIIHP